MLADDFLCTSNGQITHITFWGSFKFDEYIPSQAFMGITNFHLSIHSDIPAGGLAPHSMPGNLLWERSLNPTDPPQGWTVSVKPETPSDQGWFDPNTGQWNFPNHQNYFRYDITIPPDEAFYQTNGTIYWLDISALTLGPQWGWKTSGSEHYNDDAVWADRPVLEPLQWKELIDPVASNSLDLAFIIDGTNIPPQQTELDWGDAPDFAGALSFQTLAASNGANHAIVPGVRLGALIDAEPDGQPDPQAVGDDNTGLDDEDGVTFNSLFVPGHNAQLQLSITLPPTGGWLDVWMDADNSGNWSAGDKVYSGAVSTGTPTISFPVPSTTAPGQNVLRVRLNTAGPLPPTAKSRTT